MSDSDPKALFTYVAEQIDCFNLAYLHIVEPRVQGNIDVETPNMELSAGYFRTIYRGTVISAGGHTRETGEATLAAGHADLVPTADFTLLTQTYPTALPGMRR